MVTVSDSKLAAAALLLSLKMQDLGGWTPTLEYYSGKLWFFPHIVRKIFGSTSLILFLFLFPGYKLEEIHDICHQLNDMLHKKPKTALQTIRNKYSHK